MPQQWLAVLLFVASLAAVKLSSLESPRPPVETTAVEPKDGRYTLSNLEDPFAIIPKPTKEAEQSQTVNQLVWSWVKEFPKPAGSTKKKLQINEPSPRPWPKESQFRILMVFMYSTSDPSKTHYRQSDRQAIASALSAREYIPTENQKLRLCNYEVRRGKQQERVELNTPYEWWHRPINTASSASTNPQCPDGTTTDLPVLILWLDSEKLIPDLTGNLDSDARSCLDEIRQIVEQTTCNLEKCPSRLGRV